MKYLILSAVTSTVLTGCSLYPQPIVYDPVYSQLPHTHDAHYIGAIPMRSNLIPGRPTHPSIFAKQDDPKDLKLVDYVSLMASQLVSSSHFINAETALGVASFVPLTNYGETNSFGLQIAESFVFEMQQKGLSVIDYKSTGFIRITPDGDFVYSRNVEELSDRLAIEYFLLGTFSESKDGVVVNVRIIGARSRVVVASAQQLIPYRIYKNAVDGDPSKKNERVDGVLSIVG